MIREAEESDIPQILECLKSLSSIEYKNYDDIIRSFRSRQSSGNIITFVYEDKGTIKGTAYLILDWKLSHGGNLCVHLEDVAVNKKYQLQGIGKILRKHCIEYAKGLGAYKIILRCKESLKSYYAEDGFDFCGVYEMRKDL